MKVRSAASFLALALLGAGFTGAQDPIAVAPANHRVTLDNERTRTYEITMKPGAEIPMHSHSDHVVYVLAGGTLESTDAAGATSQRTYTTGQTVLAPAVAHRLKNVGRTTIRAVVTELKEAAPAPTLSMTERETILALYAKAQRELLDLVASTSDDLWSEKPAPDRWSVAETVEHLAAAEAMLFGMTQQALASPADLNWATVEGRMSPDAFLGFLQDRTQKFQAPEPLQPKGGWSRADALAKFGAGRAVTAEFVRRTDLPIKKHVATTPAGAMTVHQLLFLIGGHNLRHNAQIRETLEKLRAK